MNLKLCEIMHNNLLRNIVSISEELFVFMKGTSKTDAIVGYDRCKKVTCNDRYSYTVCSLIWREKNIRKHSPEGRTELVHERQGDAR